MYTILYTMDPELENIAHAQWLEPSNTRSRKAPIERLHFVKRSMTRKAIMHPNRRVSMQCMQGQDGKFYYIPLDAYNTDHLQIISELSPLIVTFVSPVGAKFPSTVLLNTGPSKLKSPVRVPTFAATLTNVVTAARYAVGAH